MVELAGDGLDSEQLLAEYQEKEGFPAHEILKRNIIYCQMLVESSMEKLELNCYKNNRILEGDLVLFRSRLISLFNYVRLMILDKVEELEKKKKYEEYRSELVLFNELVFLEQRIHPVSYKKMLVLKDFIYKYLHKMKITNLLLGKSNPFDSFEANY